MSWHSPAVIWLALLVCPGIVCCALGATPMFATDCSSVASNFTAGASGGDFEAIGCNYPPAITTVSLMDVGAGADVTVYIAFGTVAAGVTAGLSVECPPNVIAQSLSITVYGIAFGQDASFRFTGALPPRSSLLVSNNTFQLTRNNLNTFASYTPAILIGTSTYALVLEEGTTMSIDNNTLDSVIDFIGSTIAVYVMCASATLRSGSAISISGNSIVDISSDPYYLVVAYFTVVGTGTNLSLHNQSAIVMNGNSIVNSGLRYEAYVAMLNLRSGSSLTLHNQSTIVMNGNSIINSSVRGHASAANLRLSFFGSNISLTLHNQSAIVMNGNGIIDSSVNGYNCNAYVANVELTSGTSTSLTLSHRSAIVMSGNYMIDSSIGSNARAAVARLSPQSDISCKVMLSYRSTIEMDSNAIINSTLDGSLSYVAILTLNDIRCLLILYNQSTMVMRNNGFINSNISNAYSELYVACFHRSGSSGSNISHTLSNQSAIDMSGNHIINSSTNSIGGFTYVAYVYLYSDSSDSNLTLCSQSSITMSGNSITNSSVSSNASVANLYLVGNLTLNSQSAIAIRGNIYSLISTSISLASIVVVGYISLNGNASIGLDGNYASASNSPVAVLQVSAYTIRLSDSSVISVIGNRLHAPPGQGAPILTINNSGYGASCVLTLTEGSSLVVGSNEIIGDALVLDVRAGVSAEMPSTIAIVDNNVTGTSRWLTKFTGGLFLNGSLLVSGNSVAATSPIANYSFVTVTPTFSSGSMTSFNVCANNFSWLEHIDDPSLYVQPATLSALVTNCGVPLPTSSTANCSMGDICQLVTVAYDQSSSVSTCNETSLTDTVATDTPYAPIAKYIGNAAEQAGIQASFRGPALPSGNPFYYGSVRVLWPEGMANVTYVSPASPSMAACWVHSSSNNMTVIHVAVEALTVASDAYLDPKSVPVALMALFLNVSCGAENYLFNRTIAMERPVVNMPKKVYVPEKSVQNLATATGALSVTVGAVAVPMAAAQQGVVLALLRMAQCEKDTLNGEPLDMSLHPLQFGLGGGFGRYGRGALLGNLLVIPAIWCALLYLLAPFAIRALTGRTLDASRDFVGWPGMAVLPLTVLSEGSAMASVGLLTQGGAGDIVMGHIGLAILLVTTACWAAELRRMRRLVQLRRTSGAVSWAVVPFHPRFEWEAGKVGEVASASYLDKRMQLVGSSWWLWSELAAQSLSIVVGVAEGLPVGHSLCRARWAVASLAAVLQAVVVMSTTVPIELFLLGLIGTITSILVVLVALTTFDYGSPDSTFSALDAVGTANSILGMFLILMGALAAAYESYRKRSKGEADASHSETLCNLKDLPTSPSNPTSEDIPPNGGHSLFSGIPSILDDTDLREAADGKYVAFEPFEL